MQKWLAKADTDNDGKLSADELRTHAETMKKEHFARMDKNGDGALTADEVGSEHWEHLKVADTDNNGNVTASEIEQAFASGKLKGPGHGHRAGGPGKRLFALDANQHGALSADEVGTAKWAHISAADADRDGKVTKDEMKAAHKSGKIGPPKRHIEQEDTQAE